MTMPILGKKAEVEPPKELVPVKNGLSKVTLFAEVPEAMSPFVAAELLKLVSVLGWKIALNPACWTVTFCATSSVDNSNLNWKPLPLNVPLVNVLNGLLEKSESA